MRTYKVKKIELIFADFGRFVDFAKLELPE